MINEQLRHLAVPTSSLTSDPRNAREHGDANLKAIKESLRQFGQQKPIVVNRDGIVIAGNGTLAAAVDLGWTEVAVVQYDGTGAEAGFAIADNRTAELAKWDYRSLAVNLRSLKDEGFDLESLGWKDHEIKPLMEARWEPPKVSDEAFQTSEGQNTSPIKLTAEQRVPVDRAIARVRTETGDPKMSEGRAVELICAEYLS